MTIDGYCTIGVEHELEADLRRLLSEMDAAAVAQSVIAPSDRYLAVENRAGNDAILAAAEAHRDRLIPACSANPWFGHAAVEELRRCRNAGARMLVLHPFRQGFLLDEHELVDPLIEAAESIPVYVHTGMHGGATPFQLSHLALRHPTVSFLMGHSGATDYWNDVQVAVTAACNLYIESSFARPFVFESHCRNVGFDRAVMGSGFPFNPLAFEWRMMEGVLPRDEYPGIYGGTLQKLLNVGGPS